MSLSPRQTLLLFAIAAVAAAWCGNTEGSVTTIAGKDKVKKEVRILASPTSLPASIFAVPEDREFVITDLAIHNFSVTDDVDVFLAQDVAQNELTSDIHLNARGQSLHAFVTGPVVAPGSELMLFAIGTNPSVDAYVAGYLRKP